MTWTRTAPCEVIGHGGADGFYRANTRASFEKALELGVDRIECDVTGDIGRELILAHHSHLNFEETKRPLRTLSIDQIRSVDPDIIRLSDALELTRGKVPLMLDIKPRGLDDEFVSIIRAMRAEDDVSVSSTHARTLRVISSAEPQMRVGLSRGQTLTRIHNARLRHPASWTLAGLQAGPLISLGKWCGATEMMLNFNICVPPLVQALHRAGFRVYPWTVDRVADIERLLEAGVDGIITHRPDVLIDTMKKLGVPRL